MKAFKYKHMVLSLLILAIAISSVAFLAWMSNRRISANNSFTRNISHTNIVKIAEGDRAKDIVAICGVTGSNLYFQTKDPRRILSESRDLTKVHDISIPVPADKIINSSFFYKVDSPYVRLFARNSAAVFTSSLQGDTLSKQPVPGVFIRGAIVPNRYLVLYGWDASVKKSDQVFIKIDLKKGSILKTMPTPLKGHDGIELDGLLHFDTTTNLFTYISFYSNNFVCFDSSLNKIAIHHTIDTFTTIQAQSGFTSSESDVYTNTVPSRIINWTNRTNGGKLFNQSFVKGDNENQSSFHSNSVIDVYDLSTGKYQHSIYIPRYKEQKMQQFEINNDQIIALYKDYIVIYQLPSFK